MLPPLVGISACVRDINTLPYHAANERYVVAVAELCGAVPVLVPAIGDLLDFEGLLGRLDGLVLTGSPSNVEPHHYGHDRANDTILHDPARDATTLPLIRLALERGLPLFAICRGHQELNVALGGTLHQLVHELPGRRDHRSDKSLPVGQRAGIAHAVHLTEGGWLAGLMGTTEAEINSLHMQAIDRPAPGLDIEAVAEDGVIEAVRVRDARGFAVGVQWHPECLWREHDLSRRLFEEFAAATRRYAAARGEVSAAA